MSKSLAGNYSIYSGPAPGNGTFLNTPLIWVGTSAPLVARQLFPEFNETAPPIWQILEAGNPGSNLYTVSSNGVAIAIEGGNLLVPSFINVSKPAEFSIEPAGDNQYRFHVPNVDSVWTLGNYSGQTWYGARVGLNPDQGLQSQRWTLNLAALD